MTNEWFEPKKLAGLPLMPSTVQGVNFRAGKSEWKSRKRQGRGGGREYHISSLPKATQRALKISQTKKSQAAALRQQAGKAVALSANVSETEGQVQQLAAFNGLAPKEQDRVRARADVLAAWEAFTASYDTIRAGTDAFVLAYNGGGIALEDEVRTWVPKVSRNGLYRWKSVYAEKGPAGLATQYKATRQKMIESQPELLAFAEALVAKMPHITPTNMRDAMHGEFCLKDDDRGVTIPSVRAVQNWLSHWKAENHRLFTAVANPDAYKNKYKAAPGNASENVVRLNQRWELDSSPADILCTDGRFTLIACVDVYSRRAVMKVRKTSDSYGVALTLRRALLEWGVPEEAKTDNGADYKSQHIRMAMDTLGIHQIFAQPYAGEQKPHVERFFKTFQHSLSEMLEGYIGHSVAERQAIEAQFSFADRLTKRAQGVIKTTLSSEALQEKCDRWLNIYMHEDHSGLNGLSPVEVVRAWAEPARTISNERALDMLLEPIPGNKGERTMQKKGIAVNNHWYLAPELGARIGDRFIVRFDTEDMGRIYLFELDGAFLCQAECPRLTGISNEDMARAMKAHEKGIAEAKAELRKKARKINQGALIENALTYKEQQIEAKYENVTALPQRGVEHETPYLSGAQAAVDAADEQPGVAPGFDAQGNPEPEVEMAMVDYMKERTSGMEEAEDAHGRMRRWIALEKRVEAGETLSEFERTWKERHEKSSEWRGHKLVLDAFGEIAFSE
ncbi:DNA-binding protein [Candidatus Sororendozoicomonas aggregata]|uniref:DNA-binding protein n=1 Tax=Candidatus Sororendozoicomonas aggregata TaxID=3073239 RepID=UPI002ED21456